MMDEEKKLEEQIEQYLSKWLSKYDKDECWKDYAFDILNIVKQHPEVVAEVCSLCGGDGSKIIHGDDKNCPDCHGSGIVPKGGKP
jgi:DNA-directed RNA polymerase subunit RPC12/RpoP